MQSTKMPYVDGLIIKQNEERALITSNLLAGIPVFSSVSSDILYDKLDNIASSNSTETKANQVKTFESNLSIHSKQAIIPQNKADNPKKEAEAGGNPASFGGMF